MWSFDSDSGYHLTCRDGLQFKIGRRLSGLAANG